VLAGDGRVSELSDRFAVSPSTIRRDLHRLTQEGSVARTYGGAILHPRAVEFSVNEKQQRNFREKDAIARMASAAIAEADVVILDAGTTTGRLGWYLRERKDLTVITVGLNVVHMFSEFDGPEVVVLGGGLRRINQALLGSITESNLRRLRADKVFLGAEGVSATWGISCPTMAQSHLKELMLQQADEAFVLADHSKLGETPFAYCTGLDRPYTLLTDSGSSIEQLDAFADVDQASLVVAEMSTEAADG
jgi:DeoR/GlpR family transcriptional regulator of sugar metabolism